MGKVFSKARALAFVGVVSLLAPAATFASSGAPTIVTAPTELAPTTVLPQMASAMTPWMIGSLAIIAAFWGFAVVKRGIFRKGARGAA